MSIAPIENYFDDYWWGRAITKEEAFKILKQAEEAGLVHMTNNYKEGHFAICNCCSCCCGILRGMNELKKPNATAQSNYAATVDEDLCTACGICLERCQVAAIDLHDYAAVNERCIGCGLCVTTCPPEAISLVRRSEEDITEVPKNEKEWMAKREEARKGNQEYRNLFKKR